MPTMTLPVCAAKATTIARMNAAVVENVVAQTPSDRKIDTSLDVC
jgi:hypothetical protein